MGCYTSVFFLVIANKDMLTKYLNKFLEVKNRPFKNGGGVV
jgi:hypothetical protein